MRKPLALVVLLIVTGFFGTAGCNKNKENPKKDLDKISANKNGTPQERVAALKQEKEKWAEESGYNECVRQAEEDQAARVKRIRDKLKAAGYTDNIDCMKNYELPLCSSKTKEGFARYNAEVKANNETVVEFKNSKVLSESECAELLNKK